MKKDELVNYGLALFGSAWQAQLADELNVDRRRVQDWLRRESVPAFVDREIKEIIAQRYNEIRDAMNYRDNYRDEVNKKIETFKAFYGSELKPGDVIACKIEEVDHKGQREEYIVTIALGEQEGEGWQYLRLDEANYISDLVHLDQRIKSKLDKIFAVVREEREMKILNVEVADFDVNTIVVKAESEKRVETFYVQTTSGEHRPDLGCWITTNSVSEDINRDDYSDFDLDLIIAEANKIASRFTEEETEYVIDKEPVSLLIYSDRVVVATKNVNFFNSDTSPNQFKYHEIAQFDGRDEAIEYLEINSK